MTETECYGNLLVSCRNPQAYWNMRWQFDLPSEQWTEQMRRTWKANITKLMQLHRCENILEIGCGHAELKDLPNYLGLDFANNATQHLPTYLHCDVTRGIPLPNRTFDMTLCRLVLLHIKPSDIGFVAKEIMRVTGKAIVLCEPEPFKETQPHCFSHDYKRLFSGYEGAVITLNDGGETNESSSGCRRK